MTLQIYVINVFDILLYINTFFWQTNLLRFNRIYLSEKFSFDVLMRTIIANRV